MITDTHI